MNKNPYIKYLPSICGLLIFIFWTVSLILVINHQSIIYCLPFFLVLVLTIIYLNKKFITLYNYSYKDSLTGLNNRRYFYQNFLGFNCITILFIDIDNFKNVNSTKGHTTGDEILREISHLLKKHVRDEDKVFRWGGEEFIAALDTTQDEGVKVAERLKDAIATQSFTKNTNITVSIGIASGKMSDFEDLIQKADEALHYAKKTKNTIEIHPIEKENKVACT